MLRASIPAVLLGATLLAGSARAQAPAVPGAVAEAPLPGGLRAALEAIDDRVPADRSQFLLEFIRRFHNRPVTIRSAERDHALRALLDQLGRSTGGPSNAQVDTVPLPLSPSAWIAAGIGRDPRELVGDILRSRGHALLYYGLLSLDDPTRAWFADQGPLLADIAARHAAAFAVAAPAFRVEGSVVRVPGGARAEPVWKALVGEDAGQPADFVRELVAQEEGRLAYFFGALGQLAPAQATFAFNLDATDPADRIAAARRLLTVVMRVAGGWRPDDRAFYRPSLDPALLLGDLPSDAGGRPVVPGTRALWTAALSESDDDRATTPADPGPAAAAGDSPRVDFPWLCERVFSGDRLDDRRRYHLVLFAARVLPRAAPESARDQIDALRAAYRYPALTLTLERAKITDLAVFAAAARRAARLSSIGDDDRAVRAMEQYQGALALLTRSAMRSHLDPALLGTLVMSLSAIDVTDRGDYEGGLVRWLGAHVSELPRARTIDEAVAGPLERDALAALVGSIPVERRIVEWEGTKYRLDFAAAEARRIVRIIGERPRPYLSAARSMVAISDAVSEAGVARERLREQSAALTLAGESVALHEPQRWERNDAGRRYRDLASGLKRAADAGDARAAGRLASGLRVLADDLLARGLMELAYAAALGQPDRAPISADDAAGRHDFGLRTTGARRTAPWTLPTTGVAILRGWRVTGSLLGLDVRLADFALIRVSSRMPRKPTVEDDHRRVLTETVALMDAALLADADRDAIAGALRRGRERLAAARTPADAAAIASEIRLSPARRTLMEWVVAKDPARLGDFLSPSELFWLGVGTSPGPPGLQAWGAAGEGRLGCLCLQVPARVPWEAFAGRWYSGVFGSGLTDLNLRVAELLAELKMPAALLAPVLAPATLDVVDSATARDADDHRGIVEFVRALRVERVEQYLALLTTDGPLVPVDTDATPPAGVSR